MKLTYGELKIGDKYIAFPIEGDDKGHGGYKGTHWVYMKTKKRSIRLSDGIESDMPYYMEVIKVGI